MGQFASRQISTPPLVAAINGCLAAICELLGRENLALASFNLAQISEITAAKEARESELSQLLEQLAREPEQAQAMKSRWREMLADIRQTSEKNLARTQVALQLVEGFRARLLHNEPQTYNARRAFRSAPETRSILTSTIG